MTFIVRDLGRMTAILTGVFDAREVYSSGEETFSTAREKFFQVGNLWIAIMEGEPLPSRTYNHVAFKIRESEFAAYEERIKALGLEIRRPRPRVEGEGRSTTFTTTTTICSNCIRERSPSGSSAMPVSRAQHDALPPRVAKPRGKQ